MKFIALDLVEAFVGVVDVLFAIVDYFTSGKNDQD